MVKPVFPEKSMKTLKFQLTPSRYEYIPVDKVVGITLSEQKVPRPWEWHSVLHLSLDKEDRRLSIDQLGSPEAFDIVAHEFGITESKVPKDQRVGFAAMREAYYEEQKKIENKEWNDRMDARKQDYEHRVKKSWFVNWVDSLLGAKSKP